MIRRGSIVVPTAPPNLPHPWKVEWAGGELRCFVGRILDSTLTTANEWKPKRFPEHMSQQVMVTKMGMSPKLLDAKKAILRSQAFATPIKSGSLPIYTKDSYGRCTSSTAVLVDENFGYAKWDEGIVAAEEGDSTYVVLHKEGDKWCISMVSEADVLETDLKITAIKRRNGTHVRDWNLLQLWKSDLYISSGTSSLLFHLQIRTEPVLVPPATNPTAIRVRLEYDEVYDNNMLAVNGPNWCSDSDGTYAYYGQPTGHQRAIVTYIPQINGNPITLNITESPYIDISASGYVYLHFYRNHLITQGSVGPPQFTGYVTDEITLVEVIFDASPSLQSNSTISEYWSRVGQIVIDPTSLAVTSVIMEYNFLRTRGGEGGGISIVRTQYGGNFYGTTFKYDDSDPPNLIVDQQATVTGNSQFTSAYGSLLYPSLI